MLKDSISSTRLSGDKLSTIHKVSNLNSFFQSDKRQIVRSPTNLRKYEVQPITQSTRWKRQKQDWLKVEGTPTRFLRNRKLWEATCKVLQIRT